MQWKNLQQLKELDPYVSIWVGYQTILSEKLGCRMVNPVGSILSILLHGLPTENLDF